MQSLLVLVGAAVVFPPAGLALLWWRRGGLGMKVLGSAVILAIGAIELFKIYGLRMELDGGGSRPFFSFKSKASHDAAGEQSRAVTPAPPPPVVAAPVAAVTPPPAPVAKDYWTDFRGPGRLGIYDEMP